MRNAYGISSLVLFLAGLVLAVIGAMLFQDEDSQAIRNAWSVISLVLFIIALTLGAIAGIIRKD
jgi:uncharacterized membrane protein YhaH (DUF805 family)